MDSYQKEQYNTLEMVAGYLATLDHLKREDLVERKDLKNGIEDYLMFRKQVDVFLADHFTEICTQACYKSRLSACCSREGIIIFFADVVINALYSVRPELNKLLRVLKEPNHGYKCIFLSEKGCLWNIKPIICQLFLCDRAENEVLIDRPGLRRKWNEFKQKKKAFTWPDRPVLFDCIERHFMDAGYSSPLMYFHNSPGLLRIKLAGKNGDEGGTSP